MAQRDLLENAISINNQLAGPAKILYAPATLAMPIRIEQVIDPTGGAAATGWTAFGATRGGVNVAKNIEKQVFDDIDQIVGSYAQRTVNRGTRITTQMAEVFDTTQRGLVFEEGTPTTVSTTGATQVMVPMDSGSNQGRQYRVAVVHPKGEPGKVFALVFRLVELAGGERTLRFDRSDKASPALEMIAFPEIATSIPSEDAIGRSFDIK